MDPLGKRFLRLVLPGIEAQGTLNPKPPSSGIGVMGEEAGVSWGKALKEDLAATTYLGGQGDLPRGSKYPTIRKGTWV